MTGTPILNEIATAERAAGIPETTALPAVSGIASQQYVALGTQMAQIAPFRSGMFGTTAPTVAPQVILGASARLHLNLKRMPVGTWLLIGAPVSGRFASLTIDDLDMALDATVTVGDAGLRLTLAAGSGKVTMN